MVYCGEDLLLALSQLGDLYDAGGLGALPAGYEFAGFWNPFHLIGCVVDTPTQVLHYLGSLD